MADEPKRLTDKFALRLPEGMLGQLAAIAAANKRSTNAEVIARLEWSMAAEESRGESSAPASLPAMSDMEDRVKAAISKGLMALSDSDLDYLAGKIMARFEVEREEKHR